MLFSNETLQYFDKYGKNNNNIYNFQLYTALLGGGSQILKDSLTAKPGLSLIVSFLGQNFVSLSV